MFVLKKFISLWLMPLPVCLVLLVLGTWLIWSQRKVGFGRFLVTCGVLLLLFFSNRFVSTWLIRPLESAYRPIPELAAGSVRPPQLLACQAVVVLGGGHGEMSGVAAVDRLSSASRARLVEAVRLLRELPHARLVVSGGAAGNRSSHAIVLADAAISLGVASDRMVRIETPRDTEEEADALGRTLGTEPFALVTSAWHMRRATALMRKRGLQPLPCPCDYMVRPSTKSTWTDFLWDTESLGRSTWAIYERLGFVWSESRGKI